MELQPWSANRSAYYRAKADKLRELALAELVGAMRDRLLTLADDYQALADGLKTNKQRG